MISTIFLNKENLLESVSTCQFAQRVAMIQNKVIKNLVVDPNVLIARLKNENEVLKKELEYINGVTVREFLTEDDKNECRSFI